MDHALIAAGMGPATVRIESASQVANLWLIRYSNMLSVSSARVAQHFVERGLCTTLRIDFEQAHGSVGMCWREDDTDDALKDALLQSFLQEAERIAVQD